MSLDQIQQIAQESLDVLQDSVLPAITTLSNTVDSLSEDALATMKQARSIMTKLDPVIDKISNIETFIFALLIVVSVMILCMFLFWFFRHVYPLITKQHTHEHTADNVVKDLTDMPIRVQSVNGFESSVRKDFG